MTHVEIQEALAYNRKQGWDESEVKLIQEVTGSLPDGTWGPRTVRGVALWQEEQGLDGDGKVGPKTYDAISDHEQCPGYAEPSQAPAGDVTIGVWGDDAANLMMKASYADRLVELNISEVALMMNRANISSKADPWDLRWKDTGDEGWDSDDKIGQLAEVYAARNIRLILTCWPRPDKAQIDEMCEAMVPLLKLTNATAFEVDVEGNWKTAHLKGFRTMDEAAEYLFRAMEQALVDAGIKDGETESTTFGHHAELGRHPTVTQRLDRACVQGYSTSPRSSGPIPWNSYLAPGRHQEWIFNRARAAGAKEVVMGLAAYKQSGFKGHTADEAMKVAYDKTIELGIRHIRFWSSKWILGSQSRKAPYGARMLERLQAA
jgi:hypothetical protein